MQDRSQGARQGSKVAVQGLRAPRESTPQSLTGPILRPGENVSARQRDGDALLLDGAGLLETLLIYAHEQLPLQEVVLELVALRRRDILSRLCATPSEAVFIACSALLQLVPALCARVHKQRCLGKKWGSLGSGLPLTSVRYRGSLGGSFRLDFQFSGAAVACRACTGCAIGASLLGGAGLLKLMFTKGRCLLVTIPLALVALTSSLHLAKSAYICKVAGSVKPTNAEDPPPKLPHPARHDHLCSVHFSLLHSVQPAHILLIVDISSSTQLHPIG